MKEGLLLAPDGTTIGTCIIISQKNDAPTIKHDVGEEVLFPGVLIDAELIGKHSFSPGDDLQLVSEGMESRVRVRLSEVLPGGSVFYYIRVARA